MALRIGNPNKRKPTLRGLLRASASRLSDHPWCLTESALQSLAATYRLQEDEDEEPCDENDPDCPDFPVMAGVACVPISGVLLKSRAAFSYSFATSYAGVIRMAESAMRRNDVKSLLLVCDSPGGDSSDMLQTSEYLRSLRDEKPIAAVANDQCLSACYCLAAAAEKVFVTRTGTCGSIGVWSAHVDLSGSLAQSGVRVSLIQSGIRKTDLNPYQPLSERARADLQKECDRLRGLFVFAVSQFRGCDQGSLYQQEAACFSAEAACPLLADGVIDSVGDAMDYLQGRTKRTYLSAGSPDYSDGLRTALAAPAPRRLTAGRAALDPDVLTLEDATGRATTYTGLDLEGLNSHERGNALTGAAQRRLSMLTGLQQIKMRFPQAIGATRTFKRAATATGRTISMLPCPYGPDAYANLGNVIERYRPGCFKAGLDQDVLCFYANHSDNTKQNLLGRKSAGNLRVWEDASGVRAVCDAPHTSVGDDCLELLRAKILNGCSAGFWIVKATYEQRSDGYTRWVESAILHDVSLECEPLYKSATASLAAQASAPRSSLDNQIALLKRRLQTAPAWQQSELRSQLIALYRQQIH